VELKIGEIKHSHNSCLQGSVWLKIKYIRTRKHRFMIKWQSNSHAVLDQISGSMLLCELSSRSRSKNWSRLQVFLCIHVLAYRFYQINANISIATTLNGVFSVQGQYFKIQALFNVREIKCSCKRNYYIIENDIKSFLFFKTVFLLFFWIIRVVIICAKWQVVSDYMFFS